ncbi:hypothetical protein [Mycobacterium simiae]|uniref:hypothetical protein n=1 Tax=Mycobacterium simiae TaxID=1784 RepID=UPI0005CA560A|nr:hypothetical protein [Mycobacterium simiae]PLV48204.1 hypothetical protein X011_17605 [Mycobacterium tuberculosis variant microti OV254]BBX39806.1 hypothetical protein MSIM_12570 [Mycobacterium simiae]
MTEEEWQETAAAQAVETFGFFMLTILMNIVGGVVGGLVSKGVTWLLKQRVEKAGLPPEKYAAVLDLNRDDALRHALVLVASWSALEAYLEDFSKAVLQADMSILANKDFDKVKVPVAELLAPEDEKLDNVYQAMQAFVGTKAGTKRFEELVELLGLGGQVPKVIKDNVYNAQMIRNVWAHKAGVADLKFVRQAPQLGFTQGQLVSISLEQLRDYLIAILAYGMIVMNRYRANCGLGPMPMTNDEGGEIIDAYRDLYPPLQQEEESAEDSSDSAGNH